MMGVSPSFEECVPAPFCKTVLLTYDVLSCHQFADGDEHLFVSGCGRCSSDGVPAFDTSLDGDVVVHIVPDPLGELLELIDGELLELLSVVDAVSDRFSDDSVCLAERNVLDHEIVGKVGGIDESVLDAFPHACLVDGHGGDDRRHDGQTLGERLQGFHQGLLILLKVPVVRQR